MIWALRCLGVFVCLFVFVLLPTEAFTVRWQSSTPFLRIPEVQDQSLHLLSQELAHQQAGMKLMAVCLCLGLAPGPHCALAQRG